MDERCRCRLQLWVHPVPRPRPRVRLTAGILFLLLVAQRRTCTVQICFIGLPLSCWSARSACADGEFGEGGAERDGVGAFLDSPIRPPPPSRAGPPHGTAGATTARNPAPSVVWPMTPSAAFTRAVCALRVSAVSSADSAHALAGPSLATPDVVPGTTRYCALT